MMVEKGEYSEACLRMHRRLGVVRKGLRRTPLTGKGEGGVQRKGGVDLKKANLSKGATRYVNRWVVSCKGPDHRKYEIKTNAKLIAKVWGRMRMK